MRLLKLPVFVVFLCLAACPLWGVPTPPTSLEVTVGVMWADLVWSDESGQDNFEGYKIYRRILFEGDEGGEWHPYDDYDPPIAQSPGTGNWYHDIEVDAEVRYAYVVTVMADGGLQSGPTDEGVTDHAIWENVYGGSPAEKNLGPDAPTGLVVTTGVGWAYLTWDANTENDLSGYVAYRRVVLFEDEGGGEYRKLSDYEAIAVGGQESYHDTDVQGGVMYAYAVTAGDDVGNESAPSEEVVTGPIWGDGGGGGGCFLSTAR